MGKAQPLAGPHLGSAGAAFQHHVHTLARPQVHLQWPQLKHGAARSGDLESIFAFGATEGRGTSAAPEGAEPFCAPVQPLEAPSSVGQCEVVKAGS